MLRYLAIMAMVVAGFIRSPYYPVELTIVPAHAIFYAALGAAQIMWALFFLWQSRRRVAWLGLLLAGGSVAVSVLARVIDVPFTNTSAPADSPLTLALAADLIAFTALLLHLGRPNDLRYRSLWRTAAVALGGSILLGGVVWGGALAAEPYLPDLAHDTINQFEIFEQVAALDASDYNWSLPVGFPLPYVPEANPMTETKVELGRYLFYDTRLSGNGTMSCASCHHQDKAFTDGLVVPVGATGEAHVRNSQTLTNAAYNATFTWGNPVLTEIEQQVVIPMFGEFPVEMGITGNEDVVLARLAADPRYQALFAAAYPDVAEPITFHYAVQALSSFVRALISGNSPYDQFVYQGDYTALSESALRGMGMFLSERFECHHCHGGFNFTLSTRHANTTFPEPAFFNTGLYNVDGAGAYPRGNRGVFDITGAPEDMGRFRPPSLRNVELTAPYMHDGSIATLEEVIRFYGAGGRHITDGPNAGDGRENPFKSGFVPGFEITDEEMEDMLNFLRSLTDEDFIANPAFSNPFSG